MHRVHASVGELEFFQGMYPAEQETIATLAEPVRFEPGELLIRAGDSADHFFLIRHGRVGIELDVPGRGVVSIQAIGAGDALGWSWLVEPRRWQFDARALESTRGVAFDARRLRAAMDADAALGYAVTLRLVRMMGQRLQAARIQLLGTHGILT